MGQKSLRVVRLVSLRGRETAGSHCSTSGWIQASAARVFPFLFTRKWAHMADADILNSSFSPTMSIFNADGLTVNGVIVPVLKTILFPIFVTDLSKSFFIATEGLQIVNIRCVYGVAALSGTLTIEKLTGTTAPGSGTPVLTGTLDLTTTANTVLSGTLVGTQATIQLAPGDRLGMRLAGSLTGILGTILEIDLKRI